MAITRRSLLAGLGATLATPAWAPPAWTQAIGPQSDPWAQVDPYADPRNGFAAPGRADAAVGRPGAGVFQRGPQRQVSPEDERGEIAGAMRDYMAAMAEDGGPVADRRVQQAMQSFVSSLSKVTDRSHLPWEGHVARSDDINAWALGGGKMSFNAGLIAACDHPGELAAVVAHEMGHVDCLHALMRMQLGRTLAAADDAGMLGLGKKSAEIVLPGAARMEIRDFVGVLRAGFRRENEYEADEHAVELMRRAGMDPVWSVVFMVKLARQGHENGHHLINELVVSHPPATERAENLARLVVLNKSPQDTVTLPGWDVLKAAFPTPAKWRNT